MTRYCFVVLNILFTLAYVNFTQCLSNLNECSFLYINELVLIYHVPLAPGSEYKLRGRKRRYGSFFT